MIFPKVSVIVPNYNNANYLEDCLNSILSQTYLNVEIVIVDDHSDDRSNEIINRYYNQYPNIVRTIFLQHNHGVARARHEGIVQSTGEYIVTLDSDDYFHDNRKLEMEMKLVLNYRDKKGLDVIAFSNILLIGQQESKIQGTSENIVQGMVLKHLLTRDAFIPRDFVFAKRLYFEVGCYDFTFITHEDWDLKIRLSNRFPFYYTEIVGTAYRRHQQGLSSISYVTRKKNKLRVFNKNITLIQDDNERIAIISVFLNHMHKRDLHRLNYWKSKLNGLSKTKNPLIEYFKFYRELFNDLGFYYFKLLLKSK